MRMLNASTTPLIKCKKTESLPEYFAACHSLYTTCMLLVCFGAIIHVPQIDIFSYSAHMRNLECPLLFFWQNLKIFYGVFFAGKAVVVLFEDIYGVSHLLGG